MAALNQNLPRYANKVLQTEEQYVDIHEGFSDGSTMKLGQIVKSGTNAEDYAPTGADSALGLGVVIGFWNADGVYAVAPGAAVADNLRIRVALFTKPFAFLGLVPNTEAVVRGELHKTAAVGRLTAATTVAAVDLTWVVARAQETVTAGADDQAVLFATGGVA